MYYFSTEKTKKRISTYIVQDEVFRYVWQSSSRYVVKRGRREEKESRVHKVFEFRVMIPGREGRNND